ncbi:MAG: CDP-alcohol phosphatidyltransferase family protein [Oscillospiraceae bacterium]|nr:CDP-alcohol phosphatidyltransferase family protein [Oscillospiraceae bacterium]MCD8358870.1 CDP-alcohol phosphatidyltransferase family protein [Oscillospiraceae bacterium]
MHNFRRLLTREQICTLPNLMSLFRLLLVPFIIWAYLKDRYWLTAALILLSALTDILDGIVARKCNMVSDLGKMLDPICDKATHAALLICLLTRYPVVWLLLAFLAVKELLMAVFGALAVRRRGKVHSAKWYGKLCTVITETVILALVLFPGIPEHTALLLLALCGAAMVFSLLMYLIFFIQLLRKED